RSAFMAQKWVLKLCCMFPGEEHTLEGSEDEEVNKANPARGIYQLDSLGEYAGPIIGWMKGKEKIVKTVFPRLGNLLEWVHKDDFTSSIKSTGGIAQNISLPENALPKGGGKILPISSEIITLAGLNENDYREFEGQGLVFLKQVIQKHGECGN